MDLIIKNSRFQYMDLLRFILALSVVFFHYFYMSVHAYSVSGISPKLIDTFSVYGKLGVPIFFIISGFVILYTAHNKNLFSFLVSRVSRLLPGIMIVSVVGYMSYILLPSPSQLQNVSFIYFLQNFFGLTILPFVNNFISGSFIDGAMWSLRYELGFYFLVALLILTKHLKYLSFYAWGWLSLSIIKITLHINFLDKIPDSLTGGRFASFFLVGVLIYILKYKIDVKYKKYNILFLIIALIFSLYCVFILSDIGSPFLSMLFYMLGLIVFLLTIFFNPKPSKIYEILGGSSYLLYLIHQNTGYRIMLYFGDWYWCKSLLLALFMVVFAILLHVFIEKRMISLFKMFMLNFYNFISKRNNLIKR